TRLCDRRPYLVADRPIASHDDISAGHRTGFTRQSLAHALYDRSNCADRRHTNRDAHEEEQQTLPRRAYLPHRHANHETHRSACAFGAVPVLRSASAGVTGRPSRRASRVSASAARSASWVTSTSVAARERCTLSSRSMMWRPVVESRLPVGSSASTIGGSLASARAIAMRCCSPPESCEG